MQADNRLIFKFLESLAPLELAEEWDNSGLQVGNPGNIVKKVLLALDLDQQVLSEALEIQASLIITHHPLLFKGIKQIKEDNDSGALLTKIIRSGITVYSAHTNLDNADKGVNTVLANKLQLQDLQVLKLQGEKHYKLVVFVPKDYIDLVREAISEAGAGWIGNYSHCTFMLEGIGTFKPTEDTNPFIGRIGATEKVEEIRLETIVPARLLQKVLDAMSSAHPYEEVAYDLYPLKNIPSQTGLGRLGTLKTPMTLEELARQMGKLMGPLEAGAVRYGGQAAKKIIKRVAVCGGSGGSLWPLAFYKGADVLITGDINYHIAKEISASGMSFIDAGHYWTEQIILEPLAQYIREQCAQKSLSVEVIVSSVKGDPYKYI